MKRIKTAPDMVHGPLIPQIISFALPLMATSLLQLLYNSADIVVVGRYAGSQALAAVGATAALVSLLVNFFLGLSVGTNVVVARHLGAGQVDKVSANVHTSIALSLVCGLLVGLVGVLGSPYFLKWMSTPEDVLDLASLYMRIYFLGAPASLFYNFGAAILRAKGDTRRPLVILTATGLLNVVLNLVFVIFCGMSVDGVALATIISQYLSAIAIVYILMREEKIIRLHLKKIRFHMEELRAVLKVGLPAGFQSAMFAISNVLIQAALNSFGSAAVAGASAGNTVESFVYMPVNAFYQACMTFTSQNMGAKNYKRVPQIMKACLALAMGVALIGSALTLIFNRQLLSIFNTDPDVLDFGVRRQIMLMAPYVLLASMEVLSGQLRGMGYALTPTFIMLFFVCVFRMIWLYTVFVMWPTFEGLMSIYGVTWFITSALLLYFSIRAIRKLPKGDALCENQPS